MASVPTNYEGPVCNLNTNRNANTPQPSVPITPQIALATDLPSALQAINQIAQTLQQMLGQGWGPNNFYFGGGQGGGGGGGGGGQRPPPKPPNPGDFTEVPGSRVTTTVRIYNPDDHTQYVDVEQVQHVQFANLLKQKLTYSN